MLPTFKDDNTTGSFWLLHSFCMPSMIILSVIHVQECVSCVSKGYKQKAPNIFANMIQSQSCVFIEKKPQGTPIFRLLPCTVIFNKILPLKVLESTKK